MTLIDKIDGSADDDPIWSAPVVSGSSSPVTEAAPVI